MDMLKLAKQAFVDNLQLLQSFIEKDDHFEELMRISDRLSDLFRNGNKVLICGNGGSACDAMHFAEEFTGQFRKARKALPVIPLLEASHLTCVGNDYGFEYVFARGVEAYGKQGDLLIAISTSGNSPNIIKAVEQAKTQNLAVFCLLGKSGGALKDKGDYELIVPGTTSDRIQEIHMIILHTIIEMTERALFPENYE